jgi:hypothetical protein
MTPHDLKPSMRSSGRRIVLQSRVGVNPLRSPDANAARSAMIAMLSRSSAAHRARSRVNAAAKDSARAKMAHAVAASRALLRRLYHVERLTPAASQGCFAGRRGMIRAPRATAPSEGGLSRVVPRPSFCSSPGLVLLAAVSPHAFGEFSRPQNLEIQGSGRIKGCTCRFDGAARSKLKQ